MSQQNTFRLQKISKTYQLHRRNSLSTYQNKSPFKLAAIRSINNGIKYNDISIITGRDSNKLRVEHNEPADLTFINSHETFTLIRKKYDELKKQRMEMQEKLNRLKEEAQNNKDIESQYMKKITNAKEIAEGLENSLLIKKNLYQETSMQQKCLFHIVKRLKEDRIVYDYRKFQAESQLNSLKKQLKLINEECLVNDESTQRTKLIYEKLLKQIQKEQKERQQHLNHLRESLNNLKIATDISDSRANDIKQIAQRAMQDKAEYQKNLRNLLSTHKFLKIMLRNKMDRQMQKYKIVEEAFKNIKLATGTSETHTFVNKFLNKQKDYGELLQSINTNQKRIQLLKQQREILLKQRKQIQDQQNIYQLSKKNETSHISKQLKKLDLVQQKNTQAELENQKLYAWLIRQHKKISKLQGIELPTIQFNSQHLQKYTSQLLYWLQKSTQLQDQVSKVNPLDTYEPTKKQMDKIFRVKAKKYIQNEQHELIEIAQQQVEIQKVNENEEQNFINDLRVDMIKNNQKFMRNLKVKREQTIKSKYQIPPRKDKQQKLQQE